MGNIFGLETEMVSSNFDTIIPAIGSKYDLGIAAFAITKEHIESVDFVSYFTAGMGYAVATGDPSVDGAAPVRSERCRRDRHRRGRGHQQDRQAVQGGTEHHHPVPTSSRPTPPPLW